MSAIYEKFNETFDATYQEQSVAKVEQFIGDTKTLLSMINSSSRPTTHLQVLPFTKVAQRVLSWRIGDHVRLMSLLWRVASEVAKGFPAAYPASRFPQGAARQMPTFIAFVGELSLESYYRFMRAYTVEASIFARSGWPAIVGELRNANVLKLFSEFLAHGPLDDAVVVVSRALTLLTGADPALRTIMVFLASKTGPTYEAVWDEAKEDVLSIYRVLFAAGPSANDVLRPFCFGTVIENRAYTYFSCMALRAWKPPGESYMALYHSFVHKYAALVNASLVDYSSPVYVTVEKEFGFFVVCVILDARANGLQLNKKCLALLTSMLEHHFQLGTKPLVAFVHALHQLSQTVEFRLYYDSKSLEQFKVLLQYQALGEALVAGLLLASTPVEPIRNNPMRQRSWLLRRPPRFFRRKAVGE
ncbi:hypothetical protein METBISCDRAFT_22595 [Metschnikowia bicuspidata]|uniref:Uncharacterized protein n=1 Tax=Metschnikowia bicuspidata TaxID=27322 RepID=A0A4P9ZEC7_9ASCO|nr:hypothetical protein METBISCDRAFT_22595 [Metschnikowia bicuspidata]